MHCADSWFDWSTASGHYDARLTRNCQPGSDRVAASSTSGYQEHLNSRELIGIQKLGGCVYYFQDGLLHGCQQDPPYGMCDVSNSSVEENGNNYSTYTWLRYTDGSTSYFTGGDPTSSTS